MFDYNYSTFQELIFSKTIFLKFLYKIHTVSYTNFIRLQELTVKGLEPELERMAATHQEELAELRRAHQRQLTEAESGFARRAAALREQEANERQAAVLHEREAARHR